MGDGLVCLIQMVLRYVDYSTRTDKGTVEALSKLRLTVDDFRVMNIIGRGHFGEVINKMDF